mmetsp:Transcript_30706/g.60293  ORF Transcript_30706/g.60293 Transcript_30706/m.60293 type:complete len:229 (+) Transcript_30706:873-1559(+)
MAKKTASMARSDSGRSEQVPLSHAAARGTNISGLIHAPAIEDPGVKSSSFLCVFVQPMQAGRARRRKSTVAVPTTSSPRSSCNGPRPTSWRTRSVSWRPGPITSSIEGLNVNASPKRHGHSGASSSSQEQLSASKSASSVSFLEEPNETSAKGLRWEMSPGAVMLGTEAATKCTDSLNAGTPLLQRRCGSCTPSKVFLAIRPPPNAAAICSILFLLFLILHLLLLLLP